MRDSFDILLLPGDGIGPEVVRAARRVADAAADHFGVRLSYEERRVGLALDEYLEEIERSPSFTVRNYSDRADAEGQMAFQNLLLALGAAALESFGEAFLRTLAHALWSERDVVDEERGEELLAGSLGPGGREWLKSRPEF